ncbi:MAG: LEA type 2 family protein [Woeseiaceae bacterium]
MRVALLIAVAAISGCAGMEAVVSAPAVNLTSVEMTNADFDRQTFLLGFEVSNPNPFPLPIRSIQYRIRLGEQRFASGETHAKFTVPGDGSGEFMLSVDLDLLRTTSYVSMLIRTGIRRRMDYELSGSFTVDIPFARPLEFSNSGSIDVQAAGF